ncbi:MAG: terminase [Acidimicrobiia bacterium]
MTLLIDEQLGSRSPVHRSVPSGATGAGEEAADLAALAGLDLDGWQQDVLKAALRRRRDGKWSAFEVGLIVPRQNGKGSVLEALELAALFRHGETRQILHSAHEFKTAKEGFRRIVGLIKEYPRLEAQVDHIRYTTGEEGIETVDGSRLRFVARSSGSGRGFTADLIILDEAYNLSTDMMAAMLPTLSARPNPQLWYTSSAPLPHMMSDVLRRLCKRGRAGTSDSLAYFEWCATDTDSLDAQESWARANPALGIRISPEFVARELEALGPDEFARERLGVWSEDEKSHGVIPARAWAACEDAKSGPVGRMNFALDVSPGREWATIAVAAKSGRGGVHVEVTGDDEKFDHRPGTAWLVERAVELQAKWGGRFAVAKGSPAWSLKTELEDAEVELLPVSVEEHAQACGDLFDAVTERQLRHLGQGELDAAVAGADRRFYGDTWLWSRKTSAVDISPLVAVTLACWARSQDEQYDALDSVGV